jgi:hypothetical protein
LEAMKSSKKKVIRDILREAETINQ